MPHTCATAPEVVFETLEDLKAHYHTDWHRYNLKRKVAGLPMLTQKMFERVVNQTIALAAAAEEAEQKRGARRQGRHGGRGRNDEEDDEDEEESDSGSDWEEVSGDEAEEALQQIEARRQRRQELERLRREKEEAEEAAADDDMADADDGEPGPDVSLADNGFELVVNNKVLGARDLARYYRQKHRPESSSRAVVCARAEAGGRQLANTQQSGALPTFKKPVTEDEARVQKAAQIRQGKANLALGLSSNGPMFRGFRD